MDETKYVTWDVHREFVERIDERDKIQDRRIGELESTVKEIGRLTTAVERMAVNMEHMSDEQKKQGERLNDIEKKPAKHWESVITGIIAAIVGALGAAIASGIIR